jgi:hypothetical protein
MRHKRRTEGSELHRGTKNKLAGHYRKFPFFNTMERVLSIESLRPLREHLQYKDANSPKWVALVFFEVVTSWRSTVEKAMQDSNPYSLWCAGGGGERVEAGPESHKESNPFFTPILW